MAEDGVEEKKEKRVLWPTCPLQGRHGDWAGVRRMRNEEAKRPVCSVSLAPKQISSAEPSGLHILTALKGTNRIFSTVLRGIFTTEFHSIADFRRISLY